MKMRRFLSVFLLILLVTGLFCTPQAAALEDPDILAKAALLVDAGMSGRKLSDSLHLIDRDPQDLKGILVTHEHSDHICGLGVLARRYHLPIYATPGTIRYLIGCSQVGKIDPALFHPVSEDTPFTIGDLQICPFSISHDAAQPVGYRFTCGAVSAAVATDMGCYDEDTVAHLRGLDMLLLESNHDVNMLQVGPYPYPLKQRILGEKGHLSNEHAGRLLCEVLHDELKYVLLGHLSAENNYEALALATVTSEIEMADNPYRGDDFPIAVAPRYVPSDVYRL